jgi:hypothetical protein
MTGDVMFWGMPGALQQSVLRQPQRAFAYVLPRGDRAFDKLGTLTQIDV